MARKDQVRIRQSILASLEAQRGRRSVLLVSIRPSTMAIADKTYSMDSGRVS